MSSKMKTCETCAWWYGIDTPGATWATCDREESPRHTECTHHTDSCDEWEGEEDENLRDV